MRVGAWLSLAALVAASPVVAQDAAQDKAKAADAKDAKDADAKGDGAATPDDKAGDDKAADESAGLLPAIDEPIPQRYSFKSRDTFDGKVGAGLLYMDSRPFGATTGYGQVFWQGDWDGAFGTGLGFHWDVDVRAGLFEQRNRTFLNKREEAVLFEDGQAQPNGLTCPPEADGDPPPPYEPSYLDPCIPLEQRNDPNNPPRQLADAELTRTPYTFYTGRTYDYLRLDRLYLSYDTSFFGFGLGRMLIAPAAQASVDGVDAYFNLGNIGAIGIFGGVKPNPWHQQVVGAASGGGIDDGVGAYFAPLWAGVDIDPWSYRNTGAYSNELGPPHEDPENDNDLPWLHLGSARFLTTGGYASLRTQRFSLDASLVFDFFDLVDTSGLADPDLSGIDRIWGHTSGAWRILDQLTLAFRGTLDFIGARPLQPRDLFLDLTWRNLGPLTVGATYFKVNTFTTAYSYATFFRPLEDPYGAVRNPADPNNPWQQKAAQLDPNNQANQINNLLADGTFASQLANQRLNNGQLFIVDRDRVGLDASLAIGGTFQLYGELVGERRSDYAYTANLEFADSLDGMIDGVTGALSGGLCSFPTGDPLQPQGINPSMPVHIDLCTWGGTLGLRDPFLGDVGSFDVHVTVRNGYFQTTTRAAATLGTSVRDRLWVEAGGGVQQNVNQRVFSNFTPPLEGGQGVPFYVARQLNAYTLHGTAAWRIWEGLMVEATYFGFLEEVPFQGDTYVEVYFETPLRRETTQYTQTLFLRTLYRF